MTEPGLDEKLAAATFCRWAIAACLLSALGYRGPVHDERTGADSHTSAWGFA